MEPGNELCDMVLSQLIHRHRDKPLGRLLASRLRGTHPKPSDKSSGIDRIPVRNSADSHRAILLLLSRLALRAGDIVALRLEDMDWRDALVRVCGKSRRQECLPLPQDAGDAVLDYVENARPRIPGDRVFLTERAPHRPFACSSSITSVVVRALARAGLEDVRPQGAYLFRHSAATGMLRSGQSLEAIGALLRHRSMETTAIYAKTDAPMLLEVAQPWIGDPS